MSSSDNVYGKLIEKLTQNQIEMSKLSKENYSLIQNINSKLEAIDLNLNENTDMIGSTNNLLEEFKNIIKEFSIYATNREEHDKHLSSSMELLASTWKESLAMFGETKEIIEKIYDFSSAVTDENLALLKKTKGNIIPQLPLIQERFSLGLIELYSKFSYGFTNQFILSLITNDFASLSANDQKNMPQYKEFEERHLWYVEQVEKYGVDLGLTDFAKTLAKFFHIIYLCSIEGVEYASNKFFGNYLSELSKFDKMIYQDYE